MSSGEASQPETQGRDAAWDGFAEELGRSLAALGVGHILMLQLPETPRFGDAATYFVAAALRGREGLHAEAVSNRHLASNVQLSAEDIGRLRALGWADPVDRGLQAAGKPGEGTRGDERPGGSDASVERDEEVSAEQASQNHYRDWDWPVPFAAVAENLVDTLTSVYRVPHPTALVYDAFDDEGSPVLLPSLEIPRVPVVHTGNHEAVFRVESLDEMREMVAGVLSSLFEGGSARMNEDGDFLVPLGSALTFIRPDADPPQLHFSSPLLTGVPWSSVLLERLNGINAQMYHGRVYWHEENVIAEMDVICSPFVAEHVAIACRTMATLADRIDDELQDEFGGKTFFGEHVPAKRPAEYGGYL